MRKNTLITTIFISMLLFSAVAGILFVKLGRANPIAEKRWAEPPIISIYSPVNNETLTCNDISLNFSVSKPPSHTWLIRGGSEEFRNMLSSINITLDGKLHKSINVYNNLASPYNYFETLNNLTDGLHNLSIQTECEGWDLEVHGLWQRKLMYANSSNLISFAVNTSEPSLPPSTNPSNQQPNSFYIIVVTAVTVGTISTGLLFYFKKRKH